MPREANAKAIDKTVFPGMQGGPLMHIIAGKAVCFGEALQPEFKKYAQQIVANAKTLAETLMAGGIKLVSGGTDNHLMLVDVTPIGLTGKMAEQALDAAGITVNKNMIPFDRRNRSTRRESASAPRALTTRMKESEMKKVGAWICGCSVPRRRGRAKPCVRDCGFAGAFPVPGIG